MVSAGMTTYFSIATQNEMIAMIAMMTVMANDRVIGKSSEAVKSFLHFWQYAFSDGF
jgi:hypothetical protein